VFTRDARELAFIRGVAPDTVRVVGSSDMASLELELARHTVLVAVIVDMRLSRAERGALLKKVRSRWACPPTLALVETPLAWARAEARLHTRNHLLLAASPEEKEVRTRAFLNTAVSARLHWISSRLTVGRRYGLRGAALETYAALVICQVLRSQLSAYLGVGSAAIEKRMRVLCDTLDLPRCPESVVQFANTIDLCMATPVAPSLLGKLREQARELAQA